MRRGGLIKLLSLVTSDLCDFPSNSRVDLSRYDAAPLIAFTATKETDYGTETDGRISANLSQWELQDRPFDLSVNIKSSFGSLGHHWMLKTSGMYENNLRIGFSSQD
jgi:hypothetical protein